MALPESFLQELRLKTAFLNVFLTLFPEIEKSFLETSFTVEAIFLQTLPF